MTSEPRDQADCRASTRQIAGTDRDGLRRFHWTASGMEADPEGEFVEYAALSAPVDRDGLRYVRTNESKDEDHGDAHAHTALVLVASTPLNDARCPVCREPSAALSAPEPKERPPERFCNCASYCDADDPACPDFAAEDDR